MGNPSPGAIFGGHGPLGGPGPFLSVKSGPGGSGSTTPVRVAAPALANSENLFRAAFAAAQPGTGDFSLEAWIRAATLASGTGYFIIGAGDDAVGFGLQVIGLTGNTTGTVRAIIGDSGGRTTFDSAAAAISALNTYFHVVVRYDRDGNGSVYVNGSASGTPTSIATRSGSVSGYHTLRVAARSASVGGAASLYWNGRIGPVRIYKATLLSEAQITTLYNGGTLLKYNGLDATLKAACAGAAWDLEEFSNGTGAVTRVDATGVGNDLSDANTTPSAAYP